MIRFPIFLFVVGLLCNPPTVTAKDEPVQAVDSKAIVQAAMTLRDPFWPAGFVPSKKETNVAVVTEETVDPPNWAAARRQLKVSGVSTKSGRAFVVLDGIGIAQPGEIIGVRDALYLYKFRIKSVSRRGIKTENVSAVLIKK